MEYHRSRNTVESVSTGTGASRKRALSSGVEAAREDTPQNVSFENSVSNWREKSYRSNK